MESSKNSSENESKNVEKNSNYNPLSSDILKGFLQNNKGIESLWKKIKDNKDGKKSILYKYENDLVKLVADFTEALAKTVEESKNTENPIDLGKNLASRDNYRVMITKLLTRAGEADAFIKKFPHWTIQVGNLFANSTHYKRICRGINGVSSGTSTNDIQANSVFDILDKSGNKKIGKGSKKGFLKSISSFFNKYIKRGGMGKASKSKVTIELAKFGEYVNKPWRKWWEAVADQNSKLSKGTVKILLQEALNSNDPAKKRQQVVSLFNSGSIQGEINGNYVKLGTDDNNSPKIEPNAQGIDKNFMFSIFKEIDNKLGTQVEALFENDNDVKKLNTNDDKVKALLALAKEKFPRYANLFSIIDLKTDARKEDVELKVKEIFEGSNFKSKFSEVENFINEALEFFAGYNKKDLKTRAWYNLKFFARKLFNIDITGAQLDAKAMKEKLSNTQVEKIQSVIEANDKSKADEINKMLDEMKEKSQPNKEYDLGKLVINNEISEDNLKGQVKTFLERSFKNNKLVKLIKENDNKIIFISYLNNYKLDSMLNASTFEYNNLKSVGIILEKNIGDEGGKIKGDFKPNFEIKDNTVIVAE